jgi:type III secretory pathway component EscT
MVMLEAMLVVVLMGLLRAVGVLTVVPVLGHQGLVLGGVAS